MLHFQFLFFPATWQFDSFSWPPSQVIYDTTGFLEKNRDLLHLDSIQLLSSCSCHLPQTFASNMLNQSEKPVVGPLHKAGGADSQKLSVATKFKVKSFPNFKCSLASVWTILIIYLISMNMWKKLLWNYTHKYVHANNLYFLILSIS